MLCYFYFPDPNSSFSSGFSFCTILLWVWKITRKRNGRKFFAVEENWNFYLKKNEKIFCSVFIELFDLGRKNNFLIACKYLWNNFFVYKEFPISKLFDLKIDIKFCVNLESTFLMVGKLFVNIHENYCIIDDNQHRYCYYLKVNNSEFRNLHSMLYMTNKSMREKYLLNSCCISNADIFVASI
jgi:hypothetical protein